MLERALRTTRANVCCPSVTADCNQHRHCHQEPKRKDCNDNRKKNTKSDRFNRLTPGCPSMAIGMQIRSHYKGSFFWSQCPSGKNNCKSCRIMQVHMSTFLIRPIANTGRYRDHSSQKPFKYDQMAIDGKPGSRSPLQSLLSFN